MSYEELGNPILSLRDVSVMRSGVEVVEKVSFDIKKGDFVGLVGPNGGGKTTLILTILGHLKPYKGDVLVYGHQPACKHNLGMVGWVPQAATNLPKNIHISVRELINLGTLNQSNYLWRMDEYSASKVDQAMEMVGLKELENVDVSRLSGGQLQRVVIAKALASESDLLLLDEPLVGVDRFSRNSLLKLLDDLCHNHDKTILIISHDISAITQSTHRIIYLERSVQFDGHSKDLPNLNELAIIRGIENPHASHSAKPHTTKFHRGEDL